MTTEEALVGAAIHAWTVNVQRAETLFTALSDEQLRTPVAPGRNRLLYLWGHLIGVHDAMLPLLGIGERRHQDLDAVFVTEPDGPAVERFAAADLARAWTDVHARLQEGFARLSAAEWVRKHTAVSDADFAKNPLRHRLAVLLNRTNHLSGHLGQTALARV